MIGKEEVLSSDGASGALGQAAGGAPTLLRELWIKAKPDAA